MGTICRVTLAPPAGAGAITLTNQPAFISTGYQWFRQKGLLRARSLALHTELGNTAMAKVLEFEGQTKGSNASF